MATPRKLFRKQLAPAEGCMAMPAVASGAPMPVDSWQADSTSQSLTLRVSAQSTRAPHMATGEYGFLMELEQARQLIRDLGSAVLASDLKRMVEADDAK